MKPIILLVPAVIAGWLLFTFPLAASEETTPALMLHKKKQTISFCTDHYSISTHESISLYGAKDRKWLTENLYWGEAGYGAIGGIRSGYIEGGIIAGYQSILVQPFIYDLRLFFGAGGGGGAPQGGGMIIEPTLGLGLYINPALSFIVELGYMHFINGNISSPSIGFSLNLDYWGLQSE